MSNCKKIKETRLGSLNQIKKWIHRVEETRRKYLMLLTNEKKEKYKFNYL